jgi:ABC-type multidrug transport system ATPase subunit
MHDHDHRHPMPQTAPLLQADNLSFCHPAQPGTMLFDSFYLHLQAGVSWLSGDEGSGKTTLLQLLAGALPATGQLGQLRVRGVSLAENRLAYRQQVAWFAPRDTAFDDQTARQIFARLPARHPACDLDVLQSHIEGLSLSPHLDKALYMMSTGTRRKVLLAAALAANSAVTLLDQPFMALDRPSIDYLLGLLAEAAGHQSRAWVVADYEAPGNVALAGVIRL